MAGLFKRIRDRRGIRPALFARLLVVAAIAVLAAPDPARAQAAQMAPDDAAAFSKDIERELAARGARVALVFRTGRPRDKLPDGVRYTHGAFWVHQTVITEAGERAPGYAVYNLYAGADGVGTRSYLHQDFPFDFTRGAAVDAADVGIIIPTPEMQRKILSVMASPTYGALHQPDYSLIANPHDARFQNCNEFMLDVVTAAASGLDSRAPIKAMLAADFTPHTIPTTFMQRLFAPLADRRLRTADQRGGVRTTTFQALAAHMEQAGYAVDAYEFAYAP